MLITNRRQFDTMIKAICESPYIVFDTEGLGLNLRHGEGAIGLAIYAAEQSFYFPWTHGINTQVNTRYSDEKRWTQTKKKALAYSLYFLHEQKQVIQENQPETWLEELKSVWQKPDIHIAHNAQFDLTALDMLGFPTPVHIVDTLAMLSVVNSDWTGNKKDGIYPMFRMPDTGKEEMGSRGLKWQARLWNLADAHKGVDSLEQFVYNLDARLQTYDAHAVLGANKLSAQSFLWMLKPSEVAPYAEDDARLTYALYNKIHDYSTKWGDQEIHDKYNQYTRLVWDMQKEGFRYDSMVGQEMIDHGNATLDQVNEDLLRESGGLIHSANSPKQIKEYLEAVGINVDSTDSETLSTIDIPAVRLIEKARGTKKLLSTYVEKWQENNVRGYVHPELNVGGTGTGRLSSSSKMFGNFQNIPRSSAKEINPKSLLYPPEDMILIDIDYQALEMRLAAYVAETLIGKGRSLVLTELIENDVDVHLYTMEKSGIRDILLSGKTEEEYLISEGYDLEALAEKGYTPGEYVTLLARYAGKTTNFAALYGAGVKGIMKAAHCSAKHAQVLLNGFHAAYPALPEAMRTSESLALTPRSTPNSKDVVQYIRYPIPGLNLYRKFQWYPAQLRSSTGGTWSPRKKAASKAFNSVVQGSGGLIMLDSIRRIKDAYGFVNFVLDNNGKRVYDFTQGIIAPHITVHDSFVFSLRSEDLYIIPGILDIMCDYQTRPRLKAEVSAAPMNGSWGDTQKVENLEAWIESKGERIE